MNEMLNNLETMEIANEVNGVEEKKYSFRKLNSTDLFPMIKIISKIGLDELTQVFDGEFVKTLIGKVDKADLPTEEKKEKEEKSQMLVGIGIALKLANKIMEHIPSCEQEIYTMLGSVSETSAEYVKALDIDVFLEMIVDFVMKEEFKRFFKVASKYIKA